MQLFNIKTFTCTCAAQLLAASMPMQPCSGEVACLLLLMPMLTAIAAWCCCGCVQVCGAAGTKTTVRSVDVPHSHNSSLRSGTTRNAGFYASQLQQAGQN